MNIDIADIIVGDIEEFYTDVFRARNLIKTQVKTLNYATNWGVELEYFLSPDYEIPNEAFKAYLIEKMASKSINTNSINEVIGTFDLDWEIKISANESNINNQIIK